MTNKQIKQYLENNKDFEARKTPITDRLIIGGYQQDPNSGYRLTAKQEGIENPTQYWHLMNWSNNSSDDATFGKNIVCGEFIFYLAEATQAVDTDTLKDLCNKILADLGKGRRYWNGEIQKVCFDKIVEKITSNC
jgi:hypothetical protein